MAKRKYSSADVATVLRRARDLMNHGGRHWIKGDEELYNRDLGAHQYCMIGAVKAATKGKPTLQKLALDTLAAELDPTYNETYTKWDFAEHKYAEYPGEGQDYWDSTIAAFNDDEYTQWTDVKTKLTKLAKKLSKRKS